MEEKIYLDQIMAGEITVDHERQRDINPDHVSYLRRNWDPAAVGVIYLSKRDDNLYHCMDGQNRVAAGQEIDPTIIFNALVVEGLTPQRESELFIKFNEIRRTVSPYFRWKQHLGFEDPMYVALDGVLNERGLQVQQAASANRIACCSKLVWTYKRYGLETVDQTLAVLGASWSRTADTWRATLVGAVARLLYMNPQLQHDHLIKILGANEPLTWDAMRLGGSTGSDADILIATEIADRYNKSKRGRNRIIVDYTPEESE